MIKLIVYILILKHVTSLDGQSDPMPEDEAESIFKDPGCIRSRTSRRIDWVNVRWLLSQSQQSAQYWASEILQPERSKWDDIARDCPFGMITLWYWSCMKSLANSDTEAALQTFMWLDGYYGGMHPGLLKSGIWGIGDSQIKTLRHALIPKEWQLADRSVHNYLSEHDIQGTAKLKVYVYTEEDCPLLSLLTQGSSFCSKGQWGSEVLIHDFFLGSKVRTFNLDEADYFFVPGYGICMFEAGFLSIKEINRIYIQMTTGPYHEPDKGCLPYWLTQGQKHIFTFGSGTSASVFREWREHISQGVFLTPETGLFNDFSSWQTEPDFDYRKDVVIPGHLHRSEVVQLFNQGQKYTYRERPLLAVFFGRVDISRANSKVGSPRHDLARMLNDVEQWPEGIPLDVQIGSNLTVSQMYEAMGSAKYCLIPRGKSEWSLRFFEALFAGCVPVMLADHWNPLPFTEPYTSDERAGEHRVKIQEGAASKTHEGFQEWPLFKETDFVLRLPSVMTKSRALIDTLRAFDIGHADALVNNAKGMRCWYLYSARSVSSNLQEIYIDLDPDHLCNGSEGNALQGILNELVRLKANHKP